MAIKSARRLMGAPSKYTKEKAGQICTALAEGQSLREWCRAEKNRPHMATVMRWLEKHDDFREQYARARTAQAEYFSDEILEIADNAENDWMKRQGKDEEEYWVINGEHVQRSKLRIDSRKWLMGKLSPKKYGEKVLNEHSGPDGGPMELISTDAAAFRSSIAGLAARKGTSGED